MEDKIREAIKALEDKVSMESAMEADSHKAEIEEAARQAAEKARDEELAKIHARVYSKYEPAIVALKEIIEPVQKEEVSENKDEAIQADPVSETFPRKEV